MGGAQKARNLLRYQFENLNAAKNGVSARISSVAGTTRSAALNVLSKTKTMVSSTIDGAKDRFFNGVESTVNPAIRSVHEQVVKYAPVIKDAADVVIPSLRARKKMIGEAVKSAAASGSLEGKELEDYQRRLLHAPGEQETDDHLFEMFPGSPDSDELIVLCLGNNQDLTGPAKKQKEKGMQAVVLEQLKQGQNGKRPTILLFRTGHALYGDLLARQNNMKRHTAVAFEHTTNIVRDAVQGRGVFNRLPSIKRVSFGGYSFGGGTVSALCDRYGQWTQGMKDPPPIERVVMVDAVRLGLHHLGEPVTARPSNAGQVLHIFQDSPVNSNRQEKLGAYVVHGADLQKGKLPQDTTKRVNRTDHFAIQDPAQHREVLDEVAQFLGGKT